MAKRRGNKEGSIFQRTNGTWRAQMSVNGRRVSFTGNSQKECQAWIREIRDRLDDGVSHMQINQRYGEFLKDWLISIQPNLRASTWKQYRQITRDYIVPGLGAMKLIEIRPANIQHVYNTMLDQGKGLRTVQLTHSVIHRSLNHAMKMGVLGRNPDDATSPPKRKPKEMQIFDRHQIKRMLEVAKGIQPELYVLYHAAVSTGMRQSELLGLKWKDVDFDKRTIDVRRQLKRVPHESFDFARPKTQAGLRKVAVSKTLALELKDLRDSKNSLGDPKFDDLVFLSSEHRPIHKRTLLRDFHNLLELCRLPKIRFHDLRHTAASMMLNNGVPILVVSRMLGHSKPSVTLDIYGHLLPNMQHSAADMMEDVIHG